MNPIQVAVLSLFHPIDGFPMIKERRNNFSYIPALVLYVLFFASRIASIYITHFPLADTNPKTANIWIEIGTYLLPIVTWVIVNYAITSIAQGEAQMRELFTSVAYSLLPYIIVTVPTALLSYFFAETDGGMITGLRSAAMILLIFYIFISTLSMHGYTVGKTIGIVFITLISMVLMWALILIMYGLTSNVINFISTILFELKMIYIG